MVVRLDEPAPEMCHVGMRMSADRPARPQGERYASTVLPGFELHLDRVRRLF